MRESAEVDIPLSTASVLLAQCPDERQFIFELLQKIYFSGFASGAVASRKKFTEWKPPRNFDKNFVKDMMDIVDQFSMEMAVIHRPPFSGSLN